MPRSWIARAAAAGVALGVLYAASPVSVWFVLAVAAIYWWAARGVGAKERRYLWTLLTVALLIRVAAVLVLFLVSDHYAPTSFFWDGDGRFIKRRALAMLNLLDRIPLDPADFRTVYDHEYGWSSYYYVLAYLQYLMGPAPYGIHLFNIVLSTATATALYRLARAAYGAAAALLGLTLVLFLPTLISWSVAALKESLYVLLLAVTLLAIVTGVRTKRRATRAVALAIAAAAIVANDGVRAGATVIAVAGVVSGVAGTLVLRRGWVAAIALTAFVGLGIAVWSIPSAQAAIMTQLKASATLHSGHVNTAGNHYKLLDERLYFDASIPTMTPIEGLRFVGRALVSFVLVPLPWQISSRSELVFLPEQVLWYLVVILACRGFVSGLARDRLVTCLFASFTVIAGAVIAVNNGNVGTLVRFRDTVVPFVVWMSGLGVVETVSAAIGRTRRWMAAMQQAGATPAIEAGLD